MKNYYETLGLQEGASQEEIQNSYERLSKELDPSNNDNQDFFKEEFRLLNEAYNALSQGSILKNSDSYKPSIASIKNDSSSISSNSSDSFTVTISKEKIEQLKNREQTTDQIVSVARGLKILSILSMIGSGFFMLLFLAIIIFSGLGFGTIIIFVFVGAPFVLKLIGALKMYKGKKSGYKIYIISSTIFNILGIMSILSGNQSQPISATIFIAFMITFSILFYKYKAQLS